MSVEMSNSCQPCCTFAISKKGPKLVSRHSEVGNMGTQSEQQSAECRVFSGVVRCWDGGDGGGWVEPILYQ